MRMIVAIDRATWRAEIHLVPDWKAVSADRRARVKAAAAIAMNDAGIPLSRFLRLDAGSGPIPAHPRVDLYRDDRDGLRARVLDRCPTIAEQLPALRRRSPALVALIEQEFARRDAEIAEMRGRLDALEAGGFSPVPEKENEA